VDGNVMARRLVVFWRGAFDVESMSGPGVIRVSWCRWFPV